MRSWLRQSTRSALQPEQSPARSRMPITPEPHGTSCQALAARCLDVGEVDESVATLLRDGSVARPQSFPRPCVYL